MASDLLVGTVWSICIKHGLFLAFRQIQEKVIRNIIPFDKAYNKSEK